MGDDEKPVVPAFGTIDKVFDRFSSYLSERISAFVAFLFLLIFMGTIYGYVIIPRFPQFALYLLVAPLILALISYYNRTFASIMFVLLLFFVFLL